MCEETFKKSRHSRRRWGLIPIPLVLLIFLIPSMGRPYESLPGFTGTRLSGTVTLGGMIPTPRRFNLVLYSDPYYCGRISDGKGWRLGPSPVPGDHMALPGAVVYLDDVKKGKVGTHSGTIIQTKNCQFSPYVGVTQIGRTLHFQNWDPVQHNLEVDLTSREGAETLLQEMLHPHPDNRKSDFLSEGQTGIHRSGPEVQYQVARPGIVAFRCRLHDYMEAWHLILPHPYFSLTGENGEFTLKDVPPGNYTLVVWHPSGRKEVPITVGTQDLQDTNILMTPTSHTTYPEEGAVTNPFGIDLIGDSSIVPTVERQEWNANQHPATGDAS